MKFIYFLAIGALAGFLAGKVTKGRGFGVVGNLVVGCIGALVGGFVFSLLQLSSGGLIGNLITAFVGALALLYAVSKIKD